MSGLQPNEPDRLSYSMSEAARAVGLSQATMFRLVKDGKLETVKIGSRTLVTRAELERLLAQGAQSPKAA